MFVWSALLLTANAQWTTDSKKDDLDSKTDNKSSVQLPISMAIPLEAPVNPDTYIVGPSDILSVNIWVSPSITCVVPITPEGTLIVPTVGEIHVADLTLTNAKEKIVTEIKKKYITGNPTVTLISPRDFIVTVLGNVRFPGKYKMNATERVDKLIQCANSIIQKVTDDKLTAGTAKSEENQYFKSGISSKRYIIMKRRNEITKRIDLLQYFATRDEQKNPYLLEGDEVFVPVLDSTRNIFAVYGAVNAPGRFEYVSGDSLLDAIHLAQGFTKSALLDSIELVRFDPISGMLKTSFVIAAQIFSGSLQNLCLQAGDRIIVKDKINLLGDYRVFVEGEVLYPGIYPITKNSTRLSNVIKQAGGLTEYASIKSAELLRKNVPVDEGQLDRMVRQKSGITPEDNTYVSVEGDTRIRRDNVNVDFEKLFLAKDSSQDVIIQTEDHIVIPSTRKTIYIFGQVASPGNLPFIAGKDVDYYVLHAGGYTDDAQKGDVAIIKWTTRQWLEPSKTKIEEGDFIWVPPVVRRPASYWLAIIGQTTSIVSVALSAIILVIQLKK